MKTKLFVLPLLSLLLFSGCQSSSSHGGGGGSSKSTSRTIVTQIIPEYENVSSHGSYTGEPGIAPSHFQGFTIKPTNMTYAQIDETFTVKISVSPNLSIPAEELIFTYELSVNGIVEITPSSDTRSVDVHCLQKGDVTLTVFSFEKRYNKTLKIRVLPNDGSVDLYQPDFSTDARTKVEKEKFGWDNSSDEGKKGLTQGDATLGNHTWHFVRSQPGEIGVYSGAFKFGAGYPKNEGSMTFTTTINQSIKNIVLQLSSAAGEFTDHGSSTIAARFGASDYLKRSIGATDYDPSETAYTEKGQVPDYVIVDCAGKSGEFTFEIGESKGAIYLKSILIEYA